jgi:drug/metabolite transporter, DME family
MSLSPTTKRNGRICVLIAAALWSLSGVVTKVLNLEFPVIAFYRGLFAGLALLPVVPRTEWKFRPLLVPLCMIFGVMTLLYLGSVQLTTAANAIFLQYTSVFWLIPLSIVFLKEKPDKRALAGSVLAAAGVMGIVLFGKKEPREWNGILLGLLGAVGYSFAVVSMRKLRDLNPFWLSGIANLGGALTLGVWFVLSGREVAFPSWPVLLVLAGYGVVQMAIPYMLFARALRSLDASEAGLLSLLEPVLNPIWVFLAVGERPTITTLVGGTFLIAGVACRYSPVAWFGASPKRPEPSNVPVRSEA